jgi:soluble lytic murein transglycosylase-like protein
VKTNVDGKEKIIRFGEQGAETAGKPKAGESDRMKQKRASFKSRHAKNIAKGKSSPAYWANKVKWADGGAVKLAAGGSAALALIEQMRRSGAQSQEFDPVLASTREQRARPTRRPPAAPQAAAPLTAMQAPQTREEALPLPPTPPAMRPDDNPPPEAPPNPMRFDEGNPHVATAIQMAQRYNLPPSIFLSLIQQESGFNPAARSRRGAIGLGQLMPDTAAELRVDPHDPEQNLEGSARYFRQMLDRFGSMELALAAYNAGPGRVRRAGNTIPNIRETQQYVPSVLRRAGVQQGEFAEGGLADLDQKYAEGGRVGRVASAISRAVRRAPTPEDPPMVALHNVMPRNLIKMGESGDVAVAPSIAITRADQPYENFGTISLVADPSTVNPRNAPVYSRDAYTPRYPYVHRGIGNNGDFIVAPDPNTGVMERFPHTPENVLRSMLSSPQRATVQDESPNAILAITAPRFKSMGEMQAARDRLVPESDPRLGRWYNELADLSDQWISYIPENDRSFGDKIENVVDSAIGYFNEAVRIGPRGLNVINREYFNNEVPQELIDKTAEVLRAGRDLPTTYFEAKPRRIVPLSEFRGAIVPEDTSNEIMDILRRNNIENIARYASPEDRVGRAQQFRDLFFSGLPAGAIGAGAALSDGETSSLEDLDQKYAEGGAVMSDEEYDRRLLSRMKAQTGRVTEPTRAEQMQALRMAGRGLADTAADILTPGPEDFALAVLFGPGARAARIAGAGLLASMKPSEAEASRLQRLLRVYHAGADFKDLKPGTFTNTNRAAVENFQKQMRASKLHEFEINPQNIGGEDDVYEAARRYGVYYPDTPAGQYLEQGDDAVFEEAADILSYLRGRGFDSVRLNDGVSSEPSYVILDPSIARRYAQGGLAELEHKYAEGGAVNAEPAPYNADAVDALVKQIEAEYV